MVSLAQSGGRNTNRQFAVFIHTVWMGVRDLLHDLSAADIHHTANHLLLHPPIDTRIEGGEEEEDSASESMSGAGV